MRVPDFKKIIKFDKPFFTELGQKTVIQHRTNVQVEGRSSVGKTIGKKFPPYTAAYKRRKAQGKAVKPGETQRSRNVTTPNLTLTGRMMDSFKLLSSSKTGFIYGTTDPREAAKMHGHQIGKFGKNTNIKKKRIVANQEDPLPIDLQEKVVKGIAFKIVDNIEKTLNLPAQVVRI